MWGVQVPLYNVVNCSVYQKAAMSSLSRTNHTGSSYASMHKKALLTFYGTNKPQSIKLFNISTHRPLKPLKLHLYYNHW